jgi:probable phosphoglycerate mutase
MNIREWSIILKLLIVRHGDPDYEHDSLTEKGWKEAEYLSERLAHLPINCFYVSPLGRAKDTASCTLKKRGETAVECAWLREFSAPIHRPDVTDQKKVTWDWLPQDWMKEPRFFQLDHWHEPEILQEGKVKEEYDWVTGNLDILLEHHGYKRNGAYYQSVRPNNGQDRVFLPLWRRMRIAQPFIEYFPHGIVAWNVCRAFICDHGYHRRAS